MVKKRRKPIKIHYNESREEVTKKVLKALVGEKGTRKEKEMVIEQTLRDLDKKYYSGMNGTMIREDYRKWGIPWLKARR